MTVRREAADAGMGGLLDELRWRGMLHDATPGLAARLASGRPIRVYNGFDPTAPSLHIGNLVPIFGLLHIQRAGGTPVAVVGGATGMIGDPSGRSAERVLLDRTTIAANATAIHGQLARFLDFSPGLANGALMVDNADWLAPLGLLDFLRDVGKHFTVPYMLGKDSVQLRLDRGLSFTEFSYMLLQAYDFLHLYRALGVEGQAGGADQWGNITAGLELIRRVEGSGAAGEELAHGLAYPLLTNESGAKFGKSEAGENVWLSAELTSPYRFYQYWLNADDRDVGRYLRFFTLFPAERIAELEADLAAHPEARAAQRALAHDVTARVHGEAEAALQDRVSLAAFSREPVTDPEVLEVLHGAVDSFDFGASELSLDALGLAVASGLYASKAEARRAIAQGAYSINGARVAAAEDPLPEPVAGRYLVLRSGRRTVRIGRRRD
ncbi:MAG TPA: tyrosine--tRNA ligase [Candidatus Limnocylindrales bacterium]